MGRNYGRRKSRNLKLIIVLARATTALQRDMEPGIRKAGITIAQFSVLEALYSLGTMTVNQLIEKTLSNSGNTGVVVDNLIRAGFISKETDQKDRRVRRISLTESGRQLISGVFPEHVETINQRLELLSDQELEDLIKLLKKLGKGREGKDH